jgi:hypothetical protein
MYPATTLNEVPAQVQACVYSLIIIIVVVIIGAGIKPRASHMLSTLYH